MVFHRSTPTPARRGFTLVELMVVFVILSILASLTLAGLNVARGRSKYAKTRSTITKINSVIQPFYESFENRRVGGPMVRAMAPTPADGFQYDSYIDSSVTPNRIYGPKVGNVWGTPSTLPSKLALGVLARRRLLMLHEMPDAWTDVRNGVADVMTGTPLLPPYAKTGAVRGYAAFKASRGPSPTHESAECLYMIVTRSGDEPYAVEQFHSAEVGDKDGDGAPEFLDAWGNPIIFLRWAPGFSSPYSQTQVANAGTFHDPMDMQKVDADAFALLPLIVSGGDDGLTGLLVPAAPDLWPNLDLTSLVKSAQAPAGILGQPDPGNPTAYRDNVTNHDISR
jgi:prepilin-type N-terminal cleavage/methylation domain-containing protein